MANQMAVKVKVINLAAEVAALADRLARDVALDGLDQVVALAGAAWLLERAAGAKPSVATEMAEVADLYDHLAGWWDQEWGPPVG